MEVVDQQSQLPIELTDQAYLLIGVKAGIAVWILENLSA
jgi:hypothetical protein